jgi:hypothetical protein
LFNDFEILWLLNDGMALLKNQDADLFVPVCCCGSVCLLVLTLPLLLFLLLLFPIEFPVSNRLYAKVESSIMCTQKIIQHYSIVCTKQHQ